MLPTKILITLVRCSCYLCLKEEGVSDNTNTLSGVYRGGGGGVGGGGARGAVAPPPPLSKKMPFLKKKIK